MTYSRQDSLFVPTRNIIVPRGDVRLPHDRREFGPGTIGAVAGSRMRSAAGGLTLYDSNASAVNGTTGVGNGSTTYFAGQGEYTAPSSANIKRVVVNLTCYAGSISGFTYTCGIYTVTGANLDLTALIEESAGVTGNNGWSATPVNFDFVGAAIVSGTKYGFAISTKAAVDASNYARIDRTAAGGMAGYAYGWQSSLAYGTFSTNDIKIELWK